MVRVQFFHELFQHGKSLKTIQSPLLETSFFPEFLHSNNIRFGLWKNYIYLLLHL